MNTSPGVVKSYCVLNHSFGDVFMGKAIAYTIKNYKKLDQTYLGAGEVGKTSFKMSK